MHMTIVNHKYWLPASSSYESRSSPGVWHRIYW